MNKSLLLAYTIAAGVLMTACKSEGVDQATELQKDAAAAEIDNLQSEFFTVETEVVEDRVTFNGRLRAENRVEIFPEVQGAILEGKKPFREGISYQKGEVLLALDDTEAVLQLESSRSSFIKMASSQMADIKLDYPDVKLQYERWVESLDAGNQVDPIPDLGEKGNRFLESKGVYEFYYRIKSAEERVKKFTILAPFSGVLSAAKAETGQIVGPQFHLGTLVGTSRFILHASVDPEMVDKMEPGKSVSVWSVEQTADYTARISRINPSVDPASQQVMVYLEISGEGLREGMYLEGELETGNESELARIPKTALLRTGGVLANRDGIIKEVSVDVEHLGRETLLVRGLQTGDEIVADVSEPISGRIIN